MPGPTTTNYGWQLPEVGASDDTWGSELNTFGQAVDTQVKSNDDAAAAAQTTANAALPKAGGDMTGEVSTFTSKATRSDLGSLTTALTMDLDVANCFTATLTGSGSTTTTVSNVPTGTFLTWFILKLTNGGLRTVSWPAAFKWPAGTAPTLTSSGVDTIVGYSQDAGTSWQVAAIIGHA